MKIAIVQFPGSNCESESIRAIKQAGMEAEEFLWNRDASDLKEFDGYFIVGGFSYEDRSRSGIIASLDPLMPHIRAETEKGKPVLGICNGAQILVETGMVPGLKNYALGMALAENKRVKDGKVIGTGFYNTWVNIALTAPSTSCAFSRHLKPSEFIHVPIAHGEGRFIIPDELLKEMIANNQTVFRYCDNNGNFSNEFPVNPNGATYSLAAVTNIVGNVMAMMPHPERTPNGQPIFTSMRDYIVEQTTRILPSVPSAAAEGRSEPPPSQRRGQGEDSLAVAPSPSRRGQGEVSLSFSPPSFTPAPYSSPPTSFALPVKLIITDNESATVENALRHLGLPAKVDRFVHWEVETNASDTLEALKEAIIASGELFNKNKEFIADPFLPSVPSAAAEGRSEPPPSQRRGQGEDSFALLVRYRDDFVGEYKHEVLTGRLGLKDVKSVKRGVLWKITAEDGNIEALKKGVLNTHILFNPYSQECYSMQ